MPKLRECTKYYRGETKTNVFKVMKIKWDTILLSMFKAFEHKSDLTKHIEIYTIERSHHCRLGGNAFAQKSYLKNHMNIHIGKKTTPMHAV